MLSQRTLVGRAIRPGLKTGKDLRMGEKHDVKMVDLSWP